MDVYLPPLLWKLIVNERVTFADWQHVVWLGYSHIEALRHCDRSTFDSNYACEELCFSVTALGGSRVVELVPGGSRVRVEYASRLDYSDRVAAYRLREMHAQVAAVRRGLATQLPASVIELVAWDEFEELVCGSPEVDIEEMAARAEYSGCAAGDSMCLWLWEILRSFTQPERKAFVKFVWGRSRLPSTRRGADLHLKLQALHKTSPDAYLPVAHTWCFFSVDIPKYSTRDVMETKLRYAISNCFVIDGDETEMGVRYTSLHFTSLILEYILYMVIECGTKQRYVYS